MTSNLFAVAAIVVIAWLPGAVLFRLPIADRARRASLDAEERLFWQIAIALAVSLSIAMALGAVHRYSLTRLIAADVVLSAVLAVAARGRLRLDAAGPRVSALIVVALVALGVWRFFPPAEYIMGGKDPGTYMNEGLVLAQRGTLVYRDPLMTDIPREARDLFFTATQEQAGHFGTRFMGFQILDLDRGEVVGQFPHLLPASIGIAYGIDGLTGARRVVGVWAILGVVAFYLAAARLVGRAPAAAAAVLLALHVIEVWFGRYPNAEVAMQTLLFGALLANARAHVDGDRFFSPVAAALLALLLFLRFDTVLAIGAVLAANLLAFLRGQKTGSTFFVVLGVGILLAAVYYAGPMRAYAYFPTQFILNLRAWHMLALAGSAALLAGVLYMGHRNPSIGRAVTDALPLVVSIAIGVLAVYALFFRTPVGKLAYENAYALRMYANFYVTVPGVIGAILGYALVARRAFWRDPALLLTIAVFSVFFFFKIRIVPEHFWAARRFLPVILPGTLLLVCALATWGWSQKGVRRVISAALGAAFLLLLGNHIVRAAAPVMNHVEYAGMIPQLEQLAGRVQATDLLLVESRDAGSDAHVFALPLAYVYARNVLVLAGVRPDRTSFRLFLDWARTRYQHVYFLGGGGTELLSRHWSAVPIASQRFQVPEYESAYNGYPRSVRQKEFDFGLYELAPPSSDPPAEIDLDVGLRDDLHVVRFHAKEETQGRTFRWSQRQSFVSLTVLPASAHEVVLTLNSGGRPPAAPPADVSVFLNDTPIGSVRVGDGFQPYAFTIPEGVAAGAAASDEPARLRLVTVVWNPHDVIGSPDDRTLGVMVDRVQVR